MYDQIGCGDSTDFKDKAGDSDFWTTEMFVEELDYLIEYFKQYDLLGHSWGAYLGVSFAIDKQPAALRKLLVCNSPCDLKYLTESIGKHGAKMPQEIRVAIDKREAADSFESEEGMAAMSYVCSLHACRTLPWPKELMDMMGAMAEDSTCYKTMAGSSAMTMKATLTKKPGLDDRLHEIIEKMCPEGSLVTTSPDDIAGEETMTVWLSKTKCTVQHAGFALSSHFVMLEETEEFVKVIGMVLTQVEASGRYH